MFHFLIKFQLKTVIRISQILLIVSFLFFGTACDNKEDVKVSEVVEYEGWTDDFEDVDWGLEENYGKTEKGKYDPCTCNGIRMAINSVELDDMDVKQEIIETNKSLVKAKNDLELEKTFIDRRPKTQKDLEDKIVSLSDKLENAYDKEEDIRQELITLDMSLQACEDRVMTDPRCQPEEDGGEGEGEDEEAPTEGGFMMINPPSIHIPVGVAE